LAQLQELTQAEEAPFKISSSRFRHRDIYLRQIAATNKDAQRATKTDQALRWINAKVQCAVAAI